MIQPTRLPPLSAAVPMREYQPAQLVYPQAPDLLPPHRMSHRPLLSNAALRTQSRIPRAAHSIWFTRPTHTPMQGLLLSPLPTATADTRTELTPDYATSFFRTIALGMVSLHRSPFPVRSFTSSYLFCIAFELAHFHLPTILTAPEPSRIITHSCYLNTYDCRDFALLTFTRTDSPWATPILPPS